MKNISWSLLEFLLGLMGDSTNPITANFMFKDI